MHKVLLAYAALFALILLTAGCGGLPQHTVEKMIADQLPTAIGPADHYEVHASGHGDSIMRGRVKQITIHGDNVQMSHYLWVNTFDASASDISVDPSSRLVKSVGLITFSITLGQASIDRYMDLTADEDFDRPDGQKITLRKSDIGVHFFESVLTEKVPVTVLGTLQLSGSPNKLNFVPTHGSISKLNVPESVVRMAVNRMNPVLDLTQTQIPITVTSVTSHDDLLTVTGHVDMSVDQINKAVKQARG